MSGYESGYADGESSVEVDIHVHLTEHCGKSDEDERAWPAYTLWMWREIERLRAVVDAARPAVRVYFKVWGNDDATEEMRKLSDSLRALDGEPCPDCVDGIAPKDGNDGGTRYACPTCGGSGWWSDRQRCEGCGGSGRKG